MSGDTRKPLESSEDAVEKRSGVHRRRGQEGGQQDETCGPPQPD